LREDARRWRDCIAVFTDHIPEFRPILERDFEEDEACTPLGMWFTVNGDDFPEGDEVWGRFGSLLELALQAVEVMREEGADERDIVQLGAFVSAGVIADLSSNLSGFEELIAFMGPRTIDAARIEVQYWGIREDEIDWSAASTRYVALDLDPRVLLPTDATDGTV
jgi:hypothetical protein